MRYKTRRQFREENLMLWARNRELIEDRYLAEQKLDMLEEAFDEERGEYQAEIRVCVDDINAYRAQIEGLNVIIDNLAEGYRRLNTAFWALGGGPDRVPSETTPTDR